MNTVADELNVVSAKLRHRWPALNGAQQSVIADKLDRLAESLRATAQPAPAEPASDEGDDPLTDIADQVEGVVTTWDVYDPERNNLSELRGAVWRLRRLARATAAQPAPAEPAGEETPWHPLGETTEALEGLPVLGRHATEIAANARRKAQRVLARLDAAAHPAEDATASEEYQRGWSDGYRDAGLGVPAAAPGQERELAAWLDEQITEADQAAHDAREQGFAWDGDPADARVDVLIEVRDRLRALADDGDQEGQR